jgi:hypothetical protein
MNPTTFLRLLRTHLIACTTDPADRLCLVRTAKVRPIIGWLIHGWHA